MFNILYQLVRTARPRQWLKNVSLFAAALFAGRLLYTSDFQHTLHAFFVFCAISSGGYFINDIIDAPKDRMHPIKKNRPIASGKVPEALAWFVAFLLIIGGVTYSALVLGEFFTYIVLTYILIQVLYSTYFRNVIILDSMVVASGFMLRVFAGGIASNTSISAWLMLTTIGISLLLAFGKRRSEKTIVARFLTDDETKVTRKTLRHYPDALLDAMISMAATYTIITYSLFTFQISPQTSHKIISQFLPSIIKSPKWMMLSIPFVIYGVARYLYVIYEKHEGESPERVLLSDLPLLLTVLIWGISVLAFIYLLPILG